MSRQWRIFVVEDDESLHRHMVNVLRKEGYVVHGATNKREAVRFLSNEEYDAVICDVKHALSDDIELLQWLRAYRPNARVIFVGVPDKAARTFVLESGAASYIERPLDVNRVKEELHRLLAQTGFSANLDSFDLLDVIQIVSSSRKNIALLVSTGLEERGMLCFQQGNMVWAEYGTLRGEEAFFALAAHKNGTVIHQPWNQRVTPNVTQPLSRLILQAFQYRTKYASQQVSGEHAAVRVEQGVQATPASSYEEDDTPFLVALEEATYNGHSSQPILSAQQQGQHIQYTQQSQQGQAHKKVPYGVHEMAFQGSTSDASKSQEPDGTSGAAFGAKEWWQQTGKMTAQPTIQQRQQQTIDAGNTGVIGTTGNTGPTENATQSSRPIPAVPVTPIFEKPLSDSSGMRRVPPGMRKTHMRSDPATQKNQDEQQVASDTLPSWLTDQQTATRLPTVPPSSSAASVPPTPVLRSTHPLSLSPSVKLPQIPGTPKISSAEWQGGSDASQSGPLQGITASRLANTSVPLVSERESARQNGRSAKHNAVKRDYNYASLVASLQTLGYSVQGFIAAAVVTMDGQPVAQVAVDDMDISGLCQHLSRIVRDMLYLLREGNLGEFEDTVITSGNRTILLRVIRDRNEDEHLPRNEEEAFQVLITSRKTDTTECIRIMANVEGAIATALRY